MNVYLLTPEEAGALISEYRAYCCYGPPYPDTRNGRLLKERDDIVIHALRARSLREPA